MKLGGPQEPFIRRLEVERFSLISSKPFDQIVAALQATIGHPNMKDFWESAHNAMTMAEMETIVA